MAFMPFPIPGRGQRQQAPNYTPQLVQQTGSDILGAFLAMMQMKASQKDAGADRRLQLLMHQDNQDIANRTAALSERRFDEFEKVSLGIQQKLMEAGLTKEQSEVLATVASRQKETLGGKFARAQEALPGRFDEAINLGLENYGDIRESFRSITSEFKNQGLGIPGARTKIQELAQRATTKIMADPDPASQIAGMRLLATEVERAKEWAPNDLEPTLNKINNHLGELQTAGLSPGTLINKYNQRLSDSHVAALEGLMKGQEGIASGFYADRDFAKARIGYGALSPEVDTSLAGLNKNLGARNYNVGALNFDPVQGLAQTAGPTLNRADQSWGETLFGSGGSVLDALLWRDPYRSSKPQIPAIVDPNTISTGSAAKMQQQALDIASQALTGRTPGASFTTNQQGQEAGLNTASLLQALLADPALRNSTR